jgi:hypothetical protein
MVCHCKIKFLINESAIPLSERNNPRYQTKKNAMENALSEPGFTDKACIHEAGHLIFFARMGITDFHYPVPYMEHDGTEFDYTLASVRPKQPREVDIASEQMLPALAKAATAGGAFLRLLRDQKDGRDGDDQHRFFLQCIRLGYNIQKKDLWEEGQRAVEDEILHKPDLRDRAEQIARYLKSALFLQILPSPHPTS